MADLPLLGDELRRRLALERDRQLGIDPGEGNDRGYAFNQWLPVSTNKVGSASWVQQGADPKLAVPEVLQGGLLGGADLYDSPRTGKLTPEALTSLLAGGTTSGGLLAPAGSLGVFGGRLSQTADKQALQRAKNMESYPPDQVWEKTGWGQARDLNWRYEINDQSAKYLKPQDTRDLTLSGVLDHPELYKAYPALKNVRVAFTDLPKGNLGSVGQRAGESTPLIILNNSIWAEPEKARNVLLHEVQHLVQGKEGFAQGGSLNELDVDTYRRLAGEVEARNVEGRSYFGPATRRENAPWRTQDTPASQQTVRGLLMPGSVPTIQQSEIPIKDRVY